MDNLNIVTESDIDAQFKIKHADLLEFIQDIKKPIRFSDQDGKISIYDIFKVMNIKGNEKKRMMKYKAVIKNHGIEMLLPNYKWLPDTKEIKSITSSISTPCTDIDHMTRLIAYYLSRSHRTEDEINEIVECFNLPDAILSSAYVPQAEKQLIAQLTKAFPCKAIEQFCIGDYRIDLYLPQFKIAIECDEFNHDEYDPSSDDERTRFITRQLNCKWVRFDPYASTFNIFAVIRDIFKHLIRTTCEECVN
jgi:very-short-patch-repair endonuclease